MTKEEAIGVALRKKKRLKGNGVFGCVVKGKRCLFAVRLSDGDDVMSADLWVKGKDGRYLKVGDGLDKNI